LTMERSDGAGVWWECGTARGARKGRREAGRKAGRRRMRQGYCHLPVRCAGASATAHRGRPVGHEIKTNERDGSADGSDRRGLAANKRGRVRFLPPQPRGPRSLPRLTATVHRGEDGHTSPVA
jgi:hypothetical protein